MDQSSIFSIHNHDRIIVLEDRKHNQPPAFKREIVPRRFGLTMSVLRLSPIWVGIGCSDEPRLLGPSEVFVEVTSPCRSGFPMRPGKVAHRNWTKDFLGQRRIITKEQYISTVTYRARHDKILHLLQLGSYLFYQWATGIFLIVTWGKTTTPHCERSVSQRVSHISTLMLYTGLAILYAKRGINLRLFADSRAVV